MTPVMRIASPMNKHRGAEYGSPHISMAMKGDISKMDALVQHLNLNAAAHDPETEKESRDMSGSREDNHVKTEYASEAEQSDGGYQSSPSSPMISQMSVMETPAMVSPGLPHSRQNDAIFREPNAATSWSYVVSSNPPPSPLGTTTRSSSGSGETLLTSNMSQLRANLPHSKHAKSPSFETETPPRNLPKSFSFGSPANTNTYQQTSLGVPPSYSGHSSFKDSTLPAVNLNHQGALPSSPMMSSTPYQEFKPRNPSMGTYSPISLGDSSMHSMTTDQTSPMSSPSLSPHVSPATNPRKQHRDPPAWYLSDSVAEHHSEPSSPHHHHHHHHHHHRLHSHLPQSIPEHHRHEPDDPALYGHHRSYVASSPPRHMHPQSVGSHHHHHPAYPRRSGPKPYGAGPATSHTPLHHRSSTEVLKTLLRKKACLYEPQTSFAVSLVTWLVGRRLALSQGYFTRQQLQAGVHSCVAGKIREGHVTRTKVNRCMQVILNSCFHYIIPRPDGSEECGEAFRRAFVPEAADEEHLLGTLPPPWNDLNILCVADEESHSSGLLHDSDDDHPPLPCGKPGCKESSAASQASDSLESGKRSVLLCFNENIRSASDVFRCHNEFIRDVAHTGNLSLSPEDWQSFFSGSNAFGKRGAAAAGYQSGFFHFADMHDRMDRQGLSMFRTSWCAKRYDHDHSFCAFAHVDVNKGWLRRDPFVYSYKPVMCPNVKPLPDARGCYVNMCPHGMECDHAHSEEEVLYHPETYKTLPCRIAPHVCSLGDICPHVHAEASPHPSHGYGRPGKRHYHDHAPFHRSSHGGPKRRANAAGGHAAGFGKVPEGSPMLYVDPAPLSEFEKTLVLPGLQAMFRDHSSSVFHSKMDKGPPHEYVPFGHRNTQQKTTAKSSNAPTGTW